MRGSAVAWGYENLGYMRKTFPGIHEPRGLVILGRRSDLSEEAKTALRRRNATAARILVWTYDDLVDQARVVAENMRRLALVSD